MKQYGITYNGKHSFDDFRLLLNDYTIGIPNKNKVLETIPYSSQQFDFSTIMGFQPYGRRTITFNFNFYDEENITNLESKRIAVINWLMSLNSDAKIEFDLIKDYYFLGEIRTGPDAETDWNQTGVIKVTVDAYPFKIAKKIEGSDIWDNFNFPEDIAQFTSYDIKGTKNLSLYNIGIAPLEPTIEVSSDMIIVIDSVNYKLKKGRNSIDGLVFNVGVNDITVNGTGNIEFIFRREVL